MNTCDFMDCNNAAANVSMPYDTIPAYMVHTCDQHRWMPAELCHCHCCWYGKDIPDLIIEDLRDFIKRRPHRLLDVNLKPTNPKSRKQKKEIEEYNKYVAWLKSEHQIINIARIIKGINESNSL